MGAIRSTTAVTTMPNCPPASTFALATIMYAEGLDSEGVAIAALALGLASTLMVSFVFFKTVKAVFAGKLFGPDPVLSVSLKEGRAHSA